MYRPILLILTIAATLSSPSLRAQSDPSAVSPSPPASGALVVPDSVRQMPIPGTQRPATTEERAAEPRRAGPPASQRFEVEMAKCRMAPPDARESCMREVHAARAAGVYRD